MVQKIFRLTTGSVAAGASKSDAWTADAAYTLRRITVTPRGTGTLANVQFYADKGGIPIFNPDVPAGVLAETVHVQPELDLALTKGELFNYKLTNSTAAAETYDICLVLETATWPPA